MDLPFCQKNLSESIYRNCFSPSIKMGSSIYRHGFSYVFPKQNGLFHGFSHVQKTAFLRSDAKGLSHVVFGPDSWLTGRRRRGECVVGWDYDMLNQCLNLQY